MAILTLPIVVSTTGSFVAPQVAGATVDMTPWVLPTMSPLCSAAQANSGDVANCTLAGDGSSPADRGFGTPPFPTTSPGVAIPWVDLSIGSAGHVVVAVQTALKATGRSLVVDGGYGPQTAAVVSSFQAASSLTVTGIVNAETAAALGVTNTAAGAFPPAGFVWNGWAYNGSPILASWETKMVRNTTAWGTVAAGRFQGNSDIMDLYAGFITEINQAGYGVQDVGSYAFRCTASTRKDCAELGSDSLSNHAWGLAMDMNTNANPMLSYRAAVSGGSACAVPMKTDIPRWVVQAAQRWGLYWGGYSWSSGCKSPSDNVSSTTRDPMHFEFNGNISQARAIIARNGSPTRLCTSVVGDDGVARNTCSTTLMPQAGWRLPVNTNAPASATAALVNITLTGATTPGYVTAEDCGAVTYPVRQWSNGNFGVGQTVANLSVVPIDASGRFCLYESGAVHTIVDVQGFFVPASQAGAAGFVDVNQQRVLDTRSTGVRLPGLSATALTDLAGIPSGATAVMLNATVVAPTSPGYLTADSCARLKVAAPTSSNVNFGSDAIVANLAVVPESGGSTPASACMWPSASTHLVVDTQGAFVPDTGLGLSLVTPARLADTRECADHDGRQMCGVRIGDGQMLRVTGARGTSALVNLTLTDSTGEMFAVADRCDVLATARPLRSNANGGLGRNVANLAVVPVASDGSFCVWVSRATHVVVDIQGVFEPGGALRFVTQSPTRRLDTRSL